MFNIANMSVDIDAAYLIWVKEADSPYWVLWSGQGF